MSDDDLDDEPELTRDERAASVDKREREAEAEAGKRMVEAQRREREAETEAQQRIAEAHKRELEHEAKAAQRRREAEVEAQKRMAEAQKRELEHEAKAAQRRREAEAEAQKRQREREAKARERERERESRGIEREARELERDAERFEREHEREAKALHRVKKALEREAGALGRDRERLVRERIAAERDLEHIVHEREHAERQRDRLSREREDAERERTEAATGDQAPTPRHDYERAPGERAGNDREARDGEDRERGANLRERTDGRRGKTGDDARGDGRHGDGRHGDGRHGDGRHGDDAYDDDAGADADAAHPHHHHHGGFSDGDEQWHGRHERTWQRFDRAWRRHAENRRRWETRRAEHRARWRKHRKRWKELHEEREMWMRMGKDKRDWGPWWLQARIRRRIFSWLALAFASGVIGALVSKELHWWQLVLAVVALSVMSGMIAFRLTRPLIMVIRVAQDIGDGKLDTRLDVEGHHGETRLLAMAINEMAERIQRQVVDQRQLLAAVSHELRTPLGHMRVLIDTARDNHDRKALAELESEVLVLDDLVGRLLASSRLEFGNLDCRPIDLGQLVTDIATSAGVAPEAIEAIGEVRASVDPTLVRRAVANLLDNARVHGGGAVAVRIERRAAQVAIEVDDAGPGVAPDRRADAFRAFVPSRAGGLGLGLALVSRIAVAHNGGAWITDRPGGGARVGFAVEVAPVATSRSAG